MPAAYSVFKHPRTGEWYVGGYVGRSAGRAKYYPVSDGYATKAEAERRIPHLRAAEAAMKSELSVFDSRKNPSMGKRAMKVYELHWGPTGQKLGTVTASTVKA